MFNNYSILAIYLPLIAATIFILISVAGRDLSKQVLRNYLYFAVSLLCWQVIEGLYYVFADPVSMEKLYNSKLIFSSLSAAFIIRLVAGFYKIDKKISPWLFYSAFALPLITAVLVLTGFDNNLIRSGFTVVSIYPLNEVIYEPGIWYDVNFVFSNIYVLGAGIMVMMMHYRLPKAYRNSTIAFLFALLFYLSGYIAEGIINAPVDFILIGVSLANFSIYVVIVKNERGDYLSIARREIFNYLDDAIFILDEKKRIIDANKSALQWLDMLGKKLTFTSYPEMLLELEYEGLLECSSSDDEKSVEIKITHTDILLVYKMRVIYMYDDNGEVKGEFVTLEDVTRNSLFIDRLEIDAGIDPLTGLHNRYTYEELIKTMDCQDCYPVSVIVGDVNSLKYINDTYGHMAGDNLLSQVGAIIKKNCPDNGHACRIGGDEFVIIISRCYDDGAKAVIDNIKEDLKLMSDLPFDVDMALGSVTKTDFGETLRNLVVEADKKMYNDKTRIKGESV